MIIYSSSGQSQDVQQVYFWGYCKRVKRLYPILCTPIFSDGKIIRSHHFQNNYNKINVLAVVFSIDIITIVIINIQIPSLFCYSFHQHSIKWIHKRPTVLNKLLCTLRKKVSVLCNVQCCSRMAYLKSCYCSASQILPSLSSDDPAFE